MSKSEILYHISVFSSIKPRIPQEVLLYLGGWNNRRGSSNVLFYDKITNNWSISTTLDLPFKVAYHKSFQIDRRIYSFGGYDYAAFKTNVWRFDFDDMKWEDRCPLPDTRGYFAATELNKKVYIFGGYDFLNRLATCFMYDTTTNKWSEFPALSNGRSDSASIVYQGKIIISGGFDGERTLSRNEIIDPMNPSNGWEEFPSLRQPRSGHSLVVFRGVLYAIGGFQHGSSTDSCEYFDVANNEWHVAPSMREERSTFAAICYDGFIYVIGGHALDKTTSTVERFDGKRWELANSIPKPMAAGTTILYKDPLNISKIITYESTKNFN